MKKISILVFALIFGAFTSANADKGINIGISAATGIFETEGHETEDGEILPNESGMAVAAWGSIFIEKTLGDRFRIGLDYVPMALESETAERKTNEKTVGTSNTAVDVTNTIQADFEDFTTLYAAINLTEDLYIKAGIVQVDVTTNEKLGTGGIYNNTELDGTMVGAGYQKDLDNGVFLRAEGSYVTFDGTTLTNQFTNITSGQTAGTVVVDDLNGLQGRISIGKSF
jgi:hypothetical protein